MAKRISIESKEPAKPTRPALDPEMRDLQVINAAYNLAEQQIMDGTASSQVITHFLKMGSPKERLELERLREENKLLRAKTEMLQSTQRMEELYMNAMAAFRGYQPTQEEDPTDENV